MTERQAPFGRRLDAAVQAKGSPVVLGLDPRPALLPEAVLMEAAGRHGATRFGAAAAIEAFERAVIEAVAPYVVAVKPQLAFYEALGAPGIAAYESAVETARAAGLLVIADGKRGDIGSTAEAYAQAYLGAPEPAEKGVEPAQRLREPFPLPGEADALTVNPYLGSDSALPFLRRCLEAGKGIFVLGKTSNPSAAEFQDLTADGKPLYRHVAEAVASWAAEFSPSGPDEQGAEGGEELDSVGLVVGATQPQVLAELRQILPRTPFLVPGYGAQGAGAEDVVSAFLPGGRGALIPACPRSCTHTGRPRILRISREPPRRPPGRCGTRCERL